MSAPDVSSRRTADQRFDAKWHLDPATGCHIWTGALRGANRGEGRYPGFWCDRRRKVVGAYRWALERAGVEVPDGSVCDHFVCDNTVCVNPEHVRPVTQRENVLRSNSVSALNRAKTVCLRGHPLDGDDADVHVDVNGARQCRRCKRIRRALARDH